MQDLHAMACKVLMEIVVDADIAVDVVVVAAATTAEGDAFDTGSSRDATLSVASVVVVVAVVAAVIVVVVVVAAVPSVES